MSSQFRKIQKAHELKDENVWLKNAFRKAMNAAIEQNDNAMEITKALVIALQKNGPVVVTKVDLAALHPNTRLRAEMDQETGTTTYSVYIDYPEGYDENGCYTLANGECVSDCLCLHGPAKADDVKEAAYAEAAADPAFVAEMEETTRAFDVTLGDEAVTSER